MLFDNYYASKMMLKFAGKHSDEMEMVPRYKLYMPVRVNAQADKDLRENFIPQSIAYNGYNLMDYAETDYPHVRILPQQYMQYFFGAGYGVAGMYEQGENELWLNQDAPAVFTQAECDSVIIHELVHWQAAARDKRIGSNMKMETQADLEAIMTEERDAFTAQKKFLNDRGETMIKFLGPSDDLEAHLETAYRPRLNKMLLQAQAEKQTSVKKALDDFFTPVFNG